MKKLIGLILLLGISNVVLADSFDDFFKRNKSEPGMESKRIPPKLAALFIDKEENPEAVDVLGSMTSLKYLNYYGNAEKASDYAAQALKVKAGFIKLGETTGYKKEIYLFGIRKGDYVKKIVAVVRKQKDFYFVIGKGKLSQEQVELFPMLADEI